MLGTVATICAVAALNLAAAPPPGYQLAWSDEFDGAKLDTNKWTSQTRLVADYVRFYERSSAEREGTQRSGGPTAVANPFWKAGVAKIPITPNRPLWLTGFGARTNVSQGTLQEL